MTTPDTSDRHSGRDRQASPTVAEIAAITRRLRELSARGRDVDAGERAAFLADKHALLDRITDRTTAETRTAETRTAETRSAETRSAETRSAETRSAETRSAETRSAETRSDGDRDGAGVLIPHTHTAISNRLDVDPDGFADPWAADDVDKASDGDGWFSSGADTAHHAYLDTLGHVNEDSGAVAGRWERRLADPDRRAVIAAALDRCGQAVVEPVSLDPVGEQDARREQLTRWHTDDHTTDPATGHDDHRDDEGHDGVGWS